MKAFALTILMLIFNYNLSAQRGKVTNAWNYCQSGDIAKAWETILPTIDRDAPASKKSIHHFRTYEVYGNILMSIGKSKDAKIRALHKEPFLEAFTAFKKAIEMDHKLRDSKRIRSSLVFLEYDLQTTGIKAFKNKNYTSALKHLEASLELLNIEFYNKGEEMIDTVLIFNTALSAEFSNDFNKAMFYYQKAESYDYNSIQCYAHYVNCMNQKGDRIGAFRAISKGLEKYPRSTVINLLMYDYYFENKEYAKAVLYVDRLLNWHPNNAKYHVVKGDLLEKIGKYEEAIQEFLRAIQIDPVNEYAYYSVGIHHYNCAVRQAEFVRNIPFTEKVLYKVEFAKITPMIETAIPYLEKTLVLNPQNSACLKLLKVAYFRINRQDKVNEIEAQLDGI